jgi:hypothetical protein
VSEELLEKVVKLLAISKGINHVIDSLFCWLVCLIVLDAAF